MKRDSDREVTIFTEALKLPTHERAAFLQRHCGAEEPLRQKVEALLNAHDRAGDFLTKTPTGRSLD
jgi:eukaryotic-like serine/threonine-protein kinase